MKTEKPHSQEFTFKELVSRIALRNKKHVNAGVKEKRIRKKAILRFLELFIKALPANEDHEFPHGSGILYRRIGRNRLLVTRMPRKPLKALRKRNESKSKKPAR